MEVTSAYLYVSNTLPKILESLQKAQVPDKFTNAFLQALGHKSTNDRAFINVWKGLGFLDANATPTPSYREFRDKSIAKAVLARQIRIASAEAVVESPALDALTPRVPGLAFSHTIYIN